MADTLFKSKHKAYIQQGGCCHYCGLHMWLRAPEELMARFGISRGEAKALALTAEHLIAKSEGGRHTSDNIVAACALCNHTRHKRKIPPAPEVFQAEVRRRVAKGKWHTDGVIKQMRSEQRTLENSMP